MQSKYQKPPDDCQENCPEIIKKISNQYHSFTNSARKVADYVLKNPRSVVNLSITELSELCGVSEFSVMKLCRSVNLSGYQELKLCLARDYVKPLANIHEEVEENDSIGSIADKLSRSHIATMETTKESLDMVQVQLAIEAIDKAQKLEFYGMGTSAVVAKDAYHKFFRLDFDCRYLEDGHMQAMSAAMLRENDVAVAISNSGSSKDAIEALKQAKRAGATTICITSFPMSPMAKVADIKIFTKSSENLYRGEPMENLIAQIYIIDLLFVAIALRRKDNFIANLEKTRKALTTKKI